MCVLFRIGSGVVTGENTPQTSQKNYRYHGCVRFNDNLQSQPNPQLQLQGFSENDSMLMLCVSENI